MYVIYIIMLYQTRMTFFCGTQKRETFFFPNAVTKNGLVQKRAMCSSEKSTIALLGTFTFINESFISIWHTVYKKKLNDLMVLSSTHWISHSDHQFTNQPMA